LPSVFTPWASGSDQHRPAAVIASRHRFAEHTADQRTAAPPAAGAGADAGALTDLFEGFSAGLNRLGHGTAADLVTDAGGFEAIDDRLLPGFLFLLVDDRVLTFTVYYNTLS
jgi:hypothetical protein